MIDATEIKEIRKTTNESEVNELLSSEEGWKVRDIVPNGLKFIYQLVRV